MTLAIFIAASFQSIMFDKFILNMSFHEIDWILDLDMLNICEEEVLKTIKMWINYDYDVRKQHFPDLIERMRYDPNIKVNNIKIRISTGLLYLSVSTP